MSAEKNWQFELEEYMKQGEPGQIEKSEACQTAIRRLFGGVFSHAGQIRQYNVTKKNGY